MDTFFPTSTSKHRRFIHRVFRSLNPLEYPQEWNLFWSESDNYPTFHKFKFWRFRFIRCNSTRFMMNTLEDSMVSYQLHQVLRSASKWLNFRSKSGSCNSLEGHWHSGKIYISVMKTPNSHLKWMILQRSICQSPDTCRTVYTFSNFRHCRTRTSP